MLTANGVVVESWFNSRRDLIEFIYGPFTNFGEAKAFMEKARNTNPERGYKFFNVHDPSTFKVKQD